MKETEGDFFPDQSSQVSSIGAPSLKITTFGGLSIRRNGQPVSTLHSRKAQALLVYLALNARPQPRESLAGLLWEDFPQDKAMNNLRVVLSSLRKQMGNHLVITRDTAGMDPAAAYDLDVAVLETNLDYASRIERNFGMLDREAAARIEQAIQSYKGQFLQGFFVENALEFDSWMVVERERLHLLTLDGLGKLARWELGQRDYTAGIRHVSRWIQLDPLSESAHRQMMRLLAYTGQRSAAVAQFEKCREILAEELGVEPDTKTRSLYEQIRAGELTADETITRPYPSPEIDKTDKRPHNLPVQTTTFIGRERELSQLDQQLRDVQIRLVTVVGAGGMGKTRLALKAAEGLLDQFSDGVFFVDLARLSSKDLLALAIIQALGIEFGGGDDSQTYFKTILLRYLRRKQMLLILDNFEHLLEGAILVSDIIQNAPGVKVLATSRTRLKLNGEHRFHVAGIDYPENINAADAQKYDAVRLFLTCARRAHADYKLRPDDMRHIALICKMMAGMPLAIRLAAAWVDTLTIAEIAAEIANDLDLLETNLLDSPERHRSIRALFEHSWSLLSEREREVFQRFSVFRGGATRDAIQQVTDATLGDLRGLVDMSLLGRTLKGRYEIHELAREYAAEMLQGNLGASEIVFEKHSVYYNTTVGKWSDDLKSTRQESALEEMDLEIENIRLAWNWAVEHHRVNLLEESMEGFRHFFDLLIRWQEAEKTFRLAAERFESTGSVEELIIYARLLSFQGYFSHEVERKRELYQQSQHVINWLEGIGKDVRREKALLLYFMGELASRSDFEEAVRYYRQSLSLFEELDDRYWVSDTLTFLGSTYYLWGKLDNALNLQQQSLTNFRELGNPRKIAHVLGQFLYIYARRGEFEKAGHAARERLEIYEMIGDPSAIAWGQVELGESLRHLGKFEKAETLLETAMAFHKELEHFSAFSLCANYFCFLKLDLGYYVQASDLAKSSFEWSGGRVLPLLGWPIGRDSESRRMGITLTIQGMASLALGNLAEAEHLLQRSFEVLRDIQPITLTTYHHPVLGIVYLNLNKLDQAKTHICDGLKIGMKISSAMAQIFTVAAAALYFAYRGDLERAIEIYALVSRYPWVGRSKWYRDVIGAPLNAKSASLPSGVRASALQRGIDRDLEKTVRELIAELT